MQNTILITGAGRGLGLSLTKKFLEVGYHVFAGYYQSAEQLQILSERFSSSITAIPLDVTDIKSVRRAIKKVSMKVESLDILLNNAGVHLEDKHTPFEELDFEDGHLQRSMEINAFGPLRVVQQFLSLLEKGKQKLIVNISSEAGSIADCWRKQEFGYCMSKAALNMQTKILHNCLKPRGFRLLALHPGWMRTDMGGNDADIEASESAEGIFKLIINHEHLISSEVSDGARLYFDYQGNPLRW